MNMQPCAICSNETGNRILQAREKQIGTLEAFDYLQCGRCGHLSLLAEPADMGKYYPRNYSPFHTRPIDRLRCWSYRVRSSAALGEYSLAGSLLNAAKKPYFLKWLAQAGLRRGDRLLDVGCGGGNLIGGLQCAGLKCTGIDPYFPRDPHLPGGAEIYRKDILEMSGSFQAIVFDNSLEHVPNPREQMQKAASLLAPEGCIVVRVPLSDSFVFFHYGENWFAWDAPRHRHLFTKDSFGRLATQCELRIDAMIQDAGAFSFWASEDYRNGRCFGDPESFAQSGKYTHISRRQMKDFARWAKWLNQMGAGDAATFICRKTGASMRAGARCGGGDGHAGALA